LDVTKPPTSAGSLTGMAVGRFRIGERLGAGGMGEVYRAEDTKLKRPVAIKRMSAPLRADPHYREYFFKEAERASQLNDRNIAGIYDVLEENNEIFLLMEYVEGQTLRQRLQKPVQIEQFLNLAVQCAGALAAAHAHGIVHCDVKPENIMLTPAGQVKILDFGVAKHFVRPNESTISFTGVRNLGGTLGYTPPEVLREQAPDERSDIFSLGVVFYEVLSGNCPFRAATFVGCVEKTLHIEPVPLHLLNSSIPPGLEEVVSKMIAKDPRLRYSNAAELLADLRRLRSSSSRPMTLPSPVPTASWRKRSWSLLVMMMGCVLLLGVLPFLRNGWKGLWDWSQIPDKKYVAVLPFSALDGDPSKTAFSYGLAETLSAKLAQLSQQHSLQVVAPSEIRSQQVTTIEGAREAFGANLVLEGSVRQSGSRLRINYVLVDAHTRRQLRAGTVTADASDPFAVEDRVTRSVLDALEVELGTREKTKFLAHGTTEPAAYDFYLQGRGYLQDYHKPENVENAITVFQHALERDPGYAMAYAGIGTAYWQRFQMNHDRNWVEKASAACQKAVTLSPGVADGHDCLGTVYNGTGKYEQAAEQFQQAIQLEPTDDVAFCGLASAFENLGKPADAEQTYLQAIQLRPNYWAVYNWLGQFYSKQGRYPEAGGMFSHVVRLEPDNFRGYSNLGGMLILEGKYADALPILQRAATIRPSADIFSNLATSYFYLQRYSDAAQAYEQAAKLDPRDYFIQANLGDLYYSMPGKRPEAMKAYRQAIALVVEEMRVNPRNPSLFGHIAKYYAMIGERQSALDYLKRGLAMNSTNPELLFEAALVHQQLGETDQALYWLAKSLDAGFSVTNVRDEPLFVSLRSNPRFQKLIQEKAGTNHQ
jgi:eukaryotic-like serine/threonine-protein kinase